MADKATTGDNAAKRITPHHPLFLHPSENQRSTIIQHVLTGSKNYLVWSKAMQIALHGKRKMGFIDGFCTRASQDANFRDQWDQCNAVVLSWLLNSISREISNSMINYQDAHRVWIDLKERFDTVAGSRVFSIHREIANLHQGNHSVSAYYSKLKELWGEETTLFPIPNCTCSTSRIYSESVQRQKLLQFLMGLNETFHNARSQILLLFPLPTVNKAFPMICEDESH